MASRFLSMVPGWQTIPFVIWACSVSSKDVLRTFLICKEYVLLNINAKNVLDSFSTWQETITKQRADDKHRTNKKKNIPISKCVKWNNASKYLWCGVMAMLAYQHCRWCQACKFFRFSLNSDFFDSISLRFQSILADFFL